MKRTWTIIGVHDVPPSFQWYQSLFGQSSTALAHSGFGQLLDSDGTVLLCLHEWAVENHPSLMRPDDGTPGNGCFCSSASMITVQHCAEHALSSRSSQKSLT